MADAAGKTVPPPLVTVIIPALDAEATLGTALDSALSGDVGDVEVIVVDDGSQDGTAELVRDRGDRRVRLLSTPRRRSGVGVARNIALDAARGAWVALLDADDRWDAGRLTCLLDVAHAERADVVADDLHVLRDGHATETLLSSRGLDVGPGAVLTLESYIGNDLGLLKPVVRRSLLEEHRIRYTEQRRATTDFAFGFECIRSARRSYLLGQAMYVYVKQTATRTVSSASPQFWLDCHDVTAELVASVEDEVLRSLLRERSRRAMARYHYLSAKEDLGRRHLTKALQRTVRHPGVVGVGAAAVGERLQRARRGRSRTPRSPRLSGTSRPGPPPA